VECVYNKIVSQCARNRNQKINVYPNMGKFEVLDLSFIEVFIRIQDFNKLNYYFI